MDPSHPHGGSANDAISKQLSSIQYATIDQAVAKVDMEKAYRKSLYTQMIGGYWGWNGRGCNSWTPHYPSAFGQPQKFSRL